MAATVPVVIKFLGDTKQVLDAVTGVVGGVNRLIGQVAQIQARAAGLVSGAISKVTEEYHKLRDTIGETANRGSNVLAGFSIGLAGLGAATTRTAAQFEQLEAKLVAFKGSADAAAESFQQAVAFAAKTPFDVKSIVGATAQLEAFGQAGEKNLPLVAALAAASGRPLEELSLSVGKALSGVSEGFQSLETTAGVTRAELVRFGARLNAQGGIALKTAADISAARNALRSFVETKFGDAVERQSQTLYGALSNLQDSVTNLGAAFGRELIPIVTRVARFLAGLVDKFNELSSPIRKIIVFTGLAAAGFGLLGSLALKAIVPLAGLVAVFLKLASLSGITSLLGNLATQFGLVEAGAGGLSGVLARLATGATSASGGVGLLAGSSRLAIPGLAGLSAGLRGAAASATAFLATPLGIALSAIAVAGGVAAVAIRDFEQRSIAVSKAVEEEADRLQFATQQYRKYRDAANEAAGAGSVEFGKGVREGAKQTQEALDRVSAVEAQRAYEKFGISLESANTDLEANRQAAAEVRKQLTLLNEVLDSSSENYAVVGEKSEEAQALLRQLFGPGLLVPIGQIDEKVKSLNYQFDLLGESRVEIQKAAEKIALIDPALDKATASASSLNEYLRFAGRVSDIGQLEQALSLVSQQVSIVQSELVKAFGAIDANKALQLLADPQTSEKQKAALKGYLDLLAEQTQLEERVASLVKKRQDDELAAIDRVVRRRKATNDLTLAEERAFLQRQLALVEQGTDEEIALQEKLSANARAQLEERTTRVREALDEQVSAVRSTIDAAGGGALELVDAYSKAIAQLEAFGLANRRALQDSPELLREFTGEQKRLNGELDRARDKVPTEALGKFKEALSTGLAEAGNNAEKLRVLTQAIAVVQNGVKNGAFDQAEAEREITQLKNQQLSAERAIAAEKARQANEIAGLQIASLEQEIQLLEARQSAGEKVDRELQQSRERLLQAKLGAIETERQAEIEATGNVEAANEKAKLKADSLRRDETLRQYQELTKQEGQLTESLKRQEQIRNGSLTSGISPSLLPTFSDNFGQFGGLGAGLGAARAPLSVFPSKPKAPSTRAIQAEVDRKYSSDPVGEKAGASITLVTNFKLTAEEKSDLESFGKKVQRRVQRQRTREGPGAHPGG